MSREDADQHPNDEIPELEDVVEDPPVAEPAPPPNLDLFGDTGIDVEAFREALTLRLDSEIDRIINDLVKELESSLRERAERHLRERLPEIVAKVLTDVSGGPENR